MKPDLYEVLQVDPRADAEVLEAAYRRLARKFHPDVNPAADAAIRMRDLNAAWAVLRDPFARAAYDRERHARAASSSPTDSSSPPPSTGPPPRSAWSTPSASPPSPSASGASRGGQRHRSARAPGRPSGPEPRTSARSAGPEQRTSARPPGPEPFAPSRPPGTEPRPPPRDQSPRDGAPRSQAGDWRADARRMSREISRGIRRHRGLLLIAAGALVLTATLGAEIAGWFIGAEPDMPVPTPTGIVLVTRATATAPSPTLRPTAVRTPTVWPPFTSVPAPRVEPGEATAPAGGIRTTDEATPAARIEPGDPIAPAGRIEPTGAVTPAGRLVPGEVLPPADRVEPTSAVTPAGRLEPGEAVAPAAASPATGRLPPGAGFGIGARPGDRRVPGPIPPLPPATPSGPS